MINFQIKLWASACTLAWVSACGGGGDGPPTPFLEPDAPTVPTAAGVIPCSEDDGLLGPVETYLTLPAEETHCKMTVHTATTYFSEVNRHIVGLSGGLENTLTEASRYAQPPDVTINDRILFTGQWLDVGTTGNAGELWWGRMLYPGEILGFYSHVSVGQLTWERKTHQMLQAGNLMGAVRMSSGQTSPFSSALPMRYEQLDATPSTISVISNNSSGSRGHGTVSNARLELNPSKPLSGVVTMSFQVDGRRINRTIPLGSMVSTDPLLRPRSSEDSNDVWAMRAVPSIGSQAQCTDRLGRSADFCYSPTESTDEALFYQAKVNFYGANAEYAVVHYNMEVAGPNGGRGDWGIGLVVLRLSN